MLSTKNLPINCVDVYNISTLHSVFQTISINYVFFTISVFFLFGCLSIFYIKSSQNKKLLNFELQILKTINILYVFISIVYTLCRFYIKYLFIKKLKGYTLYFKFLSLKKLYFFEYINFLNGGFFSDSIVLLSLLTGFTAIYLLNDKNLSKNLINVFYFNIFHIAVLVMVYSTNLLVMFISFELIFLPTLFFIWNVYYVKKGDKAIQFLFNWTYLGSLLVLFNILYIFKTKHTLQYEILYTLSFTTLEQSILFIFIFLGFGVKIPLFPFHFWLTKVHVEASAGFSIFLSGFLVKTALYCFYFFYKLLTIFIFKKFFIIIIIIGACESSLKMFLQLDFKKLIAYATIQEMNLISFLVVCSNTLFSNTFIIFIIFHGLLSTALFYLVDIFQKRYKTRNIFLLRGVATYDPQLSNILLVFYFIYCGFPLTIKFYLEYTILVSLLTYFSIFGIFIFLIIIVASVVGFGKVVFSILFGTKNYKFKVRSITRKEYMCLSFYLVFIVLLIFFPQI